MVRYRFLKRLSALGFYRFGIILGIRFLLAGKFAKGLARLLCPVHFTRYRELPIALTMADPKAGEKILDISSPKILALYLAVGCRTQIYATDILEDVLEEARFFKAQLGLNNLHISKEDARSLSFPDETFDKIVSVSVFEHIAPAQKGDIPAVLEAVRVLKPGGTLVLTMAFSDVYSEEYKKGTVYERSAPRCEQNFFQRFYSDDVLDENIVTPSRCKLLEKFYVGERLGGKVAGSRWANIVDAGFLKTAFFGPWQWLLSYCLLPVRNLRQQLKKPVIVCLKLRKPDRPT